MKMKHIIAMVVAIVVISHGAKAEVAQRAEDVRPLLIGSAVPETMVTTMDGQSVSLNQLLQGHTSVLIFYRGGWCPYCNAHLADIQRVEADLKTLGVQILAISPDRAEILVQSVDKNALTYQLLSDASMDTAKAFGIAFQVDAPTLDVYKGYGIDLEVASGQSHHLLPVPSVFVVNRDGLVAFSYVNPDYKQRLHPDVLVAAAKAAQ
jgi:peroxiredoxin